MNAKDAVRVGLEKLEEQHIKYFTLEDLKRQMPEWCIGKAWLYACLNKLGCHYDRSLKQWINPQCINKVPSTKNNTLNKLIQKNEKLKNENKYLVDRIKDLEDELILQNTRILDLGGTITKFMVENANPVTALSYVLDQLNSILDRSDLPKDAILVEDLRVIKLRDKIYQILDDLIYKKYCRSCKKKYLCKYYVEGPLHGFFNKLGIINACEAFKNLSQEIIELNQIITEQTNEN